MKSWWLCVHTWPTREEISAFSVRHGSAFSEHRGPASSSQLHSQHALPYFASQHCAKVGKCQPSFRSYCWIYSLMSIDIQCYSVNIRNTQSISVQAEDSAPPRPPLPRLYDYEETPPVVPPLPKEASVIRHMSVRGLKRQSDERKRDRESGQYVVNGDCKVCWCFHFHNFSFSQSSLKDWTSEAPASCLTLSCFRPTCDPPWVNQNCRE